MVTQRTGSDDVTPLRDVIGRRRRADCDVTVCCVRDVTPVDNSDWAADGGLNRRAAKAGFREPEL